MSLVLTSQQWSQIEREGAAAYPNECCGAMLGRADFGDAGNQRIVDRLEPLTNAFEAGERYHRFSLEPRELMRLEKRASEAGLAVLGFYHSHPDHPARPSEYDRSHAWPFYSYVIVEIRQGRAAEMTSWLLDEASEQFKSEEMIRQNA
jgi:proteasome lid subunit RPN8/RPN11